VLASGISRELKKVANEFIEIPESMLEEPRGPTTQTVGSASTTVDLNAAPVAEETPVETEPETTI
jgi:hypothetical protein